MMAAIIFCASAVFRYVSLRWIECPTCRGLVALVAPPADWNEPIALQEGMSQSQTFELRPKYVGPYWVEIYNQGNASGAATQLACDSGIVFRPMKGAATQHPVFSRFGQGTILGTVSIAPRHLGQSAPIKCTIVGQPSPAARLVVSRASQL